MYHPGFTLRGMVRGVSRQTGRSGVITGVDVALLGVLFIGAITAALAYIDLGD